MVGIKKRYELLVVLVLAIALALLGVQKVYAADAILDITTSYDVVDEKQLQVRSIYSVTNAGGIDSIASLQVPAIGTNVTDVFASYQDDAETDASYNPANGTITVSINRDFSGDRRQWSFVLEYTTDAGLQLGQTPLLNISPTSPMQYTVASESVSLSSSNESGLAKFQGPTPSSTQSALGKNIYKWESLDGPFSSAIGLIGRATSYADISIQTTLKNEGFWWKNIVVTLPPDSNNQLSYVRTITPEPKNVTLDLDGNILAEFSVGPKQSLNVSLRSEIEINSIQYNFEMAGSLADVPQAIKDNFTVQADQWKNNTAVSADGKTTAELLRALFDEALRYESTQTDEFEASVDRSNFFIGNARSLGIPARLVIGKVFVDSNGYISQKSIPHAWTEVFLPSIGWTTIDPNLETQAGNFGSSDVRRIALVMRGINPDFPPEELSNAEVLFTDASEVVLSEDEPIITATKHLVLPGLALHSVSVKLPDGRILDNAALQINDRPIRNLGSLAPLQTARLRNIAVGGEAFSMDTVSYGFASNGVIIEELQSGVSRVNFMPMMFIGLFAVSTMLTRHILKRRKNEVVMHAEDYGDIPEPVLEQGHLFEQKPATVEPSVPTPTVATAKKSTVGQAMRRNSSKRPTTDRTSSRKNYTVIDRKTPRRSTGLPVASKRSASKRKKKRIIVQ